MSKYLSQPQAALLTRVASGRRLWVSLYVDVQGKRHRLLWHMDSLTHPTDSCVLNARTCRWLLSHEYIGGHSEVIDSMCHSGPYGRLFHTITTRGLVALSKHLCSEGY